MFNYIQAKDTYYYRIEEKSTIQTFKAIAVMKTDEHCKI